ncbi:MAG: GFA family protein [Pseudomonadales bacterium]|nr:GFA family protein [Pseudomonadales bacterium]
MTTFKGSCHCGAVHFEVRNQEKLEGLMQCNCSLCRRRNAIMATAPAIDVVVTKGEDKLSLYQWNTQIARHYFCSICGIYTHHQRRRQPDQCGFNVACIDEVDLEKLGPITKVNGKAFSLEQPRGA